MKKSSGTHQQEVPGRKPRICILIPTHWAALMGGAQFQAQGLIKTLAESGKYDVYYLARRVKEGYASDNHEVVQICQPGFLQKLATFFEAPKLLHKLRQIEPDIIYQRVGCAYTGIAAFYAKKHNVKLLWHVASTSDCTVEKFSAYGILRRPHKYIEKRVLEYGVRHANVVVAQTEDQSALLKTHYARTADRVVRNFLETPPTPTKPSLPINILWIGNFKRIKQPQYFIEIASRLSSSSRARFVMIGSPASEAGWQAELNKKIESIPTLEHVGALSQDKVNDCLANAHILVNTSTYEGFSNTFVQAWMQQVPIVSLNVNPDGIFEKYGIGKLAGSVDNLCNAVETLINDDQQREKMGAQARDYAINNHSMANAKGLVTIIDEMLEDK